MSEPIKRSLGTTPGERQLADLCEQSFLSMWSYPNLFRDQRLPGGRGGGKELCDLLAVCGKHVIVFSEKTCAFPAARDLHTSWSRWFRRSVSASVQQLRGAQRWLQSHPDRVYMDEACRVPFPLPGLEPSTTRFHRVAIARGAVQRCAEECGGTGTLALDSDIIGAAHVERTHPNYRPFAVGVVDPDEPFVHIFDEIGIEVVLREQNTIADFVSYLEAREELIASRRLFWSDGEEDLLAVYIAHANGAGVHYFPPEDASGPMQTERGAWFDLQNRPEYQRKQSADRDSYLWDSIIEEFAGHTFAGTLVNSTATLSEVEGVLRVMALEARLHRRILARALQEKASSVRPDMWGIRSMKSPSQEDVTYIFLFYPQARSPDERHREQRRLLLQDYMFVYASLHQTHSIVGVATESGLDVPTRSHDLAFRGTQTWTAEAIAAAQEIQQRRKVLLGSTVSLSEATACEFPDPE